MNINFFNLLIFLGAIQGFLLALFFLFSSKLNKKSNLFLALLLLSFSFINTANCLWDMGFSKQTILLQHLPLNWTLMIPFALLFFVQYLINPTYKFKKWEWWLLVPFAIQIGQKLVQLCLFLGNPSLLIQAKSTFNSLIKVLEIISIVYTIVVFIISIKKINEFENKLQHQFSNTDKRSLSWLKNILLKVAFLLLLWIVPYVYAAIKNTAVANYMYPLWLSMTIVIYWLAWTMFTKRDLFEYTLPENLPKEIIEIKEPIFIENEEENEKEKQEADTWQLHYQALLNLMKTEKPYLDFDLNMTSLALKMNLSNGYLSQIINKKEGLNFYDFINKYRVEELKNRLVNKEYSHLNLYGLAMDCGFKSKSTFNAVFKKMTGCTPSEYKNRLTNSTATSNS